MSRRDQLVSILRLGKALINVVGSDTIQIFNQVKYPEPDPDTSAVPPEVVVLGWLGMVTCNTG